MNVAVTTRRKRAGMSAVSALVMIDAAATAVFVSKMGLAAEANPFMRHVIETSGFAGMFLVKVVGLMLYWTAMIWYKEARGHEYPMWPELLLCVVMVPVCIMGVVMAVFS